MVKHLDNTDANVLYISDTHDIVVPNIETRKILSSDYPIKYLHTKGLGHKLRSDEIVDEVLEHIQS